MKFKFNSDDMLSTNKTIEILRAFFVENDKYYPQVFLDECLYKIEKRRIKMNLRKLY